MANMRRLQGGIDPDHRRRFLIGIGALVLIVMLNSTWFTVEAGENAVVTRFGRYDRTVDSGLHYKLPLGFEAAEKVRVDLVRKAEFGFRTEDTLVRTSEGAIRTRYASDDLENESLMLTGDLNQAVVTWTVQYKVADPAKFLFNVRDPESTLRALSESAMRGVVGDSGIDEVLGKMRTEIESEAHKQLQAALDLYRAGLHVERVVLADANPPKEVRSAFTSVNDAEQERNTLINEALKSFNQSIPAARGQAEQTVSNAEGYQLDRVNRALGEAERFTKILLEYQKAPEVTRTRLYLEAMAELLPRVRDVIVIDDAVQGVLPHLRLPTAGHDGPGDGGDGRHE